MVPGMGGRAERELSRQALADVLERRYVEIFSMAQQKLSLSGFDELIPAGIVLTGGASKIEGATELAEEIFHSPVRMGSPHSVEGFSEIINNPIYATSVGLLLYGQKQMQEDHLNYIHSGILPRRSHDPAITRRSDWPADWRIRRPAHGHAPRPRCLPLGAASGPP